MQALKVIATAGSLWLVPIILLALTLESDSSFTQQAIIFQQGGGGGLRRRLFGASLYYSTGGTDFPLTATGRDPGRASMAETTPGLLLYAVCWPHVRALKS